MAGSSFRLDVAAFREEVLNADFMEAHVVTLAEGAKAVAEAIAPEYAEGPHPGRYKGAFKVKHGKNGGEHSDRAFAILYNDAPEALDAEFGTENNDAHHTLTHSLDSIPGEQYERAVGKNTPRDSE